MSNNKVIKNSLSQVIGNKNVESDFELCCIFCSNNKKVIEIAHRNGLKQITGYIVICKECFKILDIDKLRVKIEAR